MTNVPRIELAPGYSIARIINGCWQLSPDHGGGPSSKRDALAIFSRQVEHGFTTFDCADIYEGTEELIGRFRDSLPNPGSIEVHTKCVPDKGALAALTDAQIDAMIDRSRKRLRTDLLDLVQYHWWDYAVPGVERLTERLIEAQSAGRIRCIGVTNFDTPHIRKMVYSGVPIVSVQAQYSLLDRRPDRALSSFCAERAVNILAYGALAGGFLSDRWLGSEPPAAMNRSEVKYRLIVDEVGGWNGLQSLLRVLRGVAEKHATSVAAVAAKWLLGRPAVGAISLGVGRRARIDDRRAVLDLALEHQDLEALDACLDRLGTPPGEPYELERDPTGPHASIIRTELQETGA